MNSVGKRLGFLALLWFVPVMASAHPHVWIDLHSQVVVDRGKVTEIQETWALDEEFSQMILTDGDTNGNGAIDASEVKAVKSTYFDNLRLFDYFTHLYQGNKAIPIPKAVKDFQVTLLPSGKMQYQFTLSVNVPLSSGPLSVAFYDDSFYVDVELEKKDPVTTTAVGGGKVTMVFRPDKSKAYWGGEIVPNFAVISWVSQPAS